MKIIEPVLTHLWVRGTYAMTWWIGDPKGEGPVTRVTRFANHRWTLERWDHGQGEPALLSDPWLTLTRKAHVMALLADEGIVIKVP